MHGLETSLGIYNKLMLVLLCEGTAEFFFSFKMATTITKSATENGLFPLQALSKVMLSHTTVTVLVFSNLTSPSACPTSGFVSSRAQT